MPALVDDNEVKLRADPHARPVAAEVAIRESIPVRNSGLMLHPLIRHFNSFVSVLGERVLAEVMLVSFQHSLRLSKLLLGFVEIVGQRVKIERQLAKLIRKMSVVTDIERNAIVVDRVMHLPIPARVTIPQVRLTD